jgi:hypothetical protein
LVREALRDRMYGGIWIGVIVPKGIRIGLWIKEGTIIPILKVILGPWLMKEGLIDLRSVLVIILLGKGIIMALLTDILDLKGRSRSFIRVYLSFSGIR